MASETEIGVQNTPVVSSEQKTLMSPLETPAQWKSSITPANFPIEGTVEDEEETQICFPSSTSELHSSSTSLSLNTNKIKLELLPPPPPPSSAKEDSLSESDVSEDLLDLDPQQQHLLKSTTSLPNPVKPISKISQEIDDYFLTNMTSYLEEKKQHPQMSTSTHLLSPIQEQEQEQQEDLLQLLENCSQIQEHFSQTDLEHLKISQEDQDTDLDEPPQEAHKTVDETQPHPSISSDVRHHKQGEVVGSGNNMTSHDDQTEDTTTTNGIDATKDKLKRVGIVGDSENTNHLHPKSLTAAAKPMLVKLNVGGESSDNLNNTETLTDVSGSNKHATKEVLEKNDQLHSHSSITKSEPLTGIDECAEMDLTTNRTSEEGNEQIKKPSKLKQKRKTKGKHPSINGDLDPKLKKRGKKRLLDDEAYSQESSQSGSFYKRRRSSHSQTTQKDRSSIASPKIIITGVEATNEILQQISKIEGAAYEENIENATHLIIFSDELKRTVKLLCGISCCDFIVDEQWLIDSSTKRYPVKEENYFFKDVKAHKKWSFNLPSMLKSVPKMSRQHLFKDRHFYITPHPSVRPPLQELKSIIQFAGGSIVSNLSQDKDDIDINRLIIISTDKALKLVSVRKTLESYSSVLVFQVEFILSGLLQQSFSVSETSKFLLKSSHNQSVKVSGRKRARKK